MEVRQAGPPLQAFKSLAAAGGPAAAREGNLKEI